MGAEGDLIRDALPGAEQHEKTANALEAVRALETNLADAVGVLRELANYPIDDAPAMSDLAAAALARLDAS